MRKTTAALAALALALGLTALVAAPASADINSPANNATLRGDATIGASGASDNDWFYCSGDPRTTLRLINSSGAVVWERVKNGAGSFSRTVDTHDFANGSYTARAIERSTKKTGFANLGCGTSTKTTNRSVTIDNITALSYTGDTSAAQDTVATVRAKLTDPHLSSSVLPNRTVTFSISGGGSVQATTNGNGVATANLPIPGPPRQATITASFAQTSHYRGSSASKPFAVTRNATTTTLLQPAAVVHGQATSFTAQVSADTGTSTPGGTVQFTVDGSDFGAPVPVSGGAAVSPSTDSLTTGSHVVGATYSGDGNTLPSTASSVDQVVEKAETSVVLASSGSPTVTGEPVTFTATVDVIAPGAGNPTGAVQFTVDGNPYGTAVALSGDEASLTVGDLNAGNHQVVATYNGDADFRQSTSATLTQGVDRAATEVALSSSNPTAVAGEPVTFTADVSVEAPGSGTPTGAVQFAVDGNPIGGPVPLNGTTATSPAIGLDAGVHSITADYQGDDDYAGSQQVLTQEVGAAATTTEVSVSPSPSVVGQTVTLRAEVAPVAPATGSPEGAVQFTIDGNPGPFATLVDGVAEVDTATLAVGDHTVVATYLSADPNFVTSTSSEVGHTVNRAATETTVEASSDTSVYGQPVTFTATVSVVAPGAGSPSGTITFTDGATVLAEVPVGSGTGGQASFTTDELSVAQHAIVATYSGSGDFRPSDGSVSHQVQRAQTATVVTSSANPAESGEGVSFTATIASVAPGAGEVTGTVEFTVNGAPLGGAVDVVDGEATSSTFASLSPGNYEIEATYSGDGNFVGSSGLLDQGTGLDVTQGHVEMTASADPASAAYGEAVTFTASAEAVAPATGTPSGVVQFWEGEVLLGAASLEPAGSGATASFVSSTLAPGSHDVRVVYVGNYNFHEAVATTAVAIGQAPTVTGIEASANPITFGDDVTLTAVVSAPLPAPGDPTGTVTFTSGGDVLGVVDVESDQGRQQATLEISEPGVGSHHVVATYSGDSTYDGSTSDAFTVDVTRAEASLVAGTIVGSGNGDGGYVRATLTGVDGAPLAGETLSFWTTHYNGNTIHGCAATTDADGYAECYVTELMLSSILWSGFDVRFEGNGGYHAATDHGTFSEE